MSRCQSLHIAVKIVFYFITHNNVFVITYYILETRIGVQIMVKHNLKQKVVKMLGRSTDVIFFFKNVSA